MTAYKSRRRHFLKFPSALVAFLMVMALGFSPKLVQAAEFNGSVTLEGYNVDTKDWTGDWTTGNLAKSYAEGETFPGRARISDFQSLYPGFNNFPDLKIWYTSVYPIGGGSSDYAIFVDLVKGIQVGTRLLSDSEGWPRADGTAYPLGTAELVNIAQNHPGENEWSGYELLNLPTTQINRSAITGRIGEVGTIYDAERCFIVTAEDIKNALLAEGKDPNTVNDFYIYFEFHLARTSIFSRDLQTAYASGAPYDWGGYIYDVLDFDPIAKGAGPSDGSSSHFGMLEVKGSRDVQLPDAPETYRTVTGRKFLDANGNGAYDEGEVGLPDWEIRLTGKIEDIEVTLSDLTDADGIYEFKELSYGSTLDVFEMMEDGYIQTYPNQIISLPVGATSYMKEVAGQGSWRWAIPSMIMPEKGDTVISGVDFGNFMPEPKIEITKTGDILSKIGDKIKFTVTVKNTGNVDLNLFSIVDDKFGPLDAVTVPGGFGATLLKGATESHEFEMAIPETMEDPFVNKVTAIYKFNEIEAKGEASHETNLFQPSSEIDKTVDKATAMAGETVRYKIAVKNTSSMDTPVMHYVLEDELLGWTIAGGTAKEFDLASGQTEIIQGPETDYVIPADAERNSVITNTAVIHTSFENFDNKYDYEDSAETKVILPALEILKTGDELSKIGDEVEYSFTVKNIGDVDLHLVKVYDETFGFDLTGLFLKSILKPGEFETVKKSFPIPEGAVDPFKNKVTATYQYENLLFTKDIVDDSEFEVNLFQPLSAITKTVNKDVAVIGETVRFKIVVENLSSADTPMMNYVLEDELLGWKAADDTAMKFSLLPGESKTFEGPETDYVITAADELAGFVKNTAKVSTSFENFPNTYTYSDDAEVKVVKASLKITKTGDELSKIGDKVSYTFTVENTGMVDLHLAKIMDVTFDVDITGKFAKTVLKPGESDMAVVEFVIPEGASDPFINKVEATYQYKSADFTLDVKASATHETNLFQPDYSIVKTVDKIYAIPGETVRYKIVVKNLSSEDTPLTKIVLTDELLGWTGPDAKVFDLAYGESKTFEGPETDYVVPADAARYSIIKNTAVINTAFENFTNTYERSAYAETKVLWPMLKITKTGDELSKIGDDVTYKFVIENIGDVDLNKVQIYDETFDFDLTSLFLKDVLKVGESDSAEKMFTIPDTQDDPFKNTVKATYKYVMGSFEKSVVESSTFEVNLFQPGITIEKTANKDVSMVGDTVTYKIIVKNTSSSDAPNLIYTVNDDVYGEVVKDIEFASGEVHEYTYDYLIKATDKSPLINTAEVTASPKGFPNILTASDSHEIRLFVPDIKIEKFADTEISKVGDTIGYTIKVTNLTPEAFAPDMVVRVTDPMLGLDETFNLASGGVKTFNINYMVKASDDPDYETKYGWIPLKNTVKLFASPMGFELLKTFELEASAMVELVHPHIDLEKSVNTNLAHVGDTLTYTVKITNTGDVALENIVVKDSMMGTLTDFVTTLAPGASDEHSYTKLLTIADIGMLTNTATVMSNPVGLPNEITDKDSETVEVRQKLYMETGWAYGGTYANEINKLQLPGLTTDKWGWTNGPLQEGNYEFPIYTGAGLNDVSKGLKAGMLYVTFIDKTVTLSYVMYDGFSLNKIHLYVGSDPLPSKKTGKTIIYTADPGQFPFKPDIPDQTTSFTYKVPGKFAAPIYIASHSEVYVPYWEMNSFYNTTKY